MVWEIQLQDQLSILYKFQILFTRGRQFQEGAFFLFTKATASFASIKKKKEQKSDQCWDWATWAANNRANVSACARECAWDMIESRRSVFYYYLESIGQSIPLVSLPVPIGLWQFKVKISLQLCRSFHKGDQIALLLSFDCMRLLYLFLSNLPARLSPLEG